MRHVVVCEAGELPQLLPCLQVLQVVSLALAANENPAGSRSRIRSRTRSRIGSRTRSRNLRLAEWVQSPKFVLVEGYLFFCGLASGLAPPYHDNDDDADGHNDDADNINDDVHDVEVHNDDDVPPDLFGQMVLALGDEGPSQVGRQQLGELVVTGGDEHLGPQLGDQLGHGPEGPVVVPAHNMWIHTCSLFDFLTSETFCGELQGSQR